MAPLNIAWLLQCWTLLGRDVVRRGRPPARCRWRWRRCCSGCSPAPPWPRSWPGSWSGCAAARAAPASSGGTAVAVGGLVALPRRHRPALAAAGQQPDAARGDRRARRRQGDWLTWLALMNWLLGIAIVLGRGAGAWLADAVARRPASDELRRRVLAAPGPAAPGLGPRRPGAHRPVRHLALGADAPRAWSCSRCCPGLVALAGDLDWDMLDDPPRPGRLRRRAAVRRELLVPRRARRAVARQPAGRPAAGRSPSRVFVLVSSCCVATRVTLLLASLRAGLPTVSELVAVACATVVVAVQVVVAVAALVGAPARSPWTCAAPAPPRRRRW